jgi:hypothetical protein
MESIHGKITTKRGNGIWSSILQNAPYEMHNSWIKCWSTI